MERIDREKFILRSIIIGGALICFAYIAYTISSYDVLTFDIVIREWAYAQRSPVLNKILIGITYLGNWQTIVTLGFVLLVHPGTRQKIGLPFAITAASSTIIYKVAKSIFSETETRSFCANYQRGRLFLSQRTFYELYRDLRDFNLFD